MVQPPTSPEETSEIKRIKKLLFAEELSRFETKLKELEERLETFSCQSFHVKAVSEVLPEALDLQIQKDERRVVKSLSPVVGAAIQSQVRDQKDKIVDALYPIIGASCARYLSQALQDLMASINKRFDEQFSVGTLRRKILSKWTGVSEAELLFHQNLGARFDSLFLIHRASGTLISAVHSKSCREQDGDMIAGMFSAITGFINHWHNDSAKPAQLDTIEYGQHCILFEQSGSFIVAAVTRGERAEFLREPLHSLLVLIHQEHHEAFLGFTGDLSGLPDGVHRKLENTLSIDRAKAHEVRKQKKSGAKKWWVLAAFFGIGILGYWGWKNYQQNQLKSEVESVLIDDPYFRGGALRVSVDSDLVYFSGSLLSNDYVARLRRLMDYSFGDKVRLDTRGVQILRSATLTPLLFETLSSIEREAKSLGLSGFSVDAGDAGIPVLTGPVTKGFLVEARQWLSEVPHSYGLTDKTWDVRPYLKAAIYFSSGQTSKLRQPGSDRILKSFLEAQNFQSWVITGFADDNGPAVDNPKVARRRAEFLQTRLIDLGMDASQLEVRQFSDQARPKFLNPLSHERAVVVLPKETYE